MLKVLLAGLGVRGRHWAQVIERSERAELLAYVDPSADALARALAEFGERPVFTSVKSALDSLSDVDALVLANPPMGRERIVRAASARKLPMLIEKPLALSLAEAATLLQIVESAGVSLMVGLNFRYLAVTQATKRLLAENTVGRPEFARFTYERWRDGRRPDLNDYPADHGTSDALGAVNSPLRLDALCLWSGTGEVAMPDLESLKEYVCRRQQCLRLDRL